MRGTRPLPGHSVPLGPGAEFDRVRKIIAVLGQHSAGLGDDCALIASGDEFIACSTDVSVQGVHFRLEWITPEEIGWRSAAAALSDLAADGAEPVGLLCAVTMPSGAGEAELLQLMAGVGAAAAAAGALVLGGDLASGSSWSVAVTVVGRTGAPVMRSGARPGDRLWVTGELGGARAALEAWLHQQEPLPGARARFAHPEPRTGAGRWLARHGARAMIDLSDGLAGDAPHLAAASQVSLAIDLSSVPIAPEAEREASRLGTPPRQFAAEGGEDYELLVAMPGDFSDADRFRSECSLPLTQIGEVAAGSGVRFLLSGSSVHLRGFDHFG